MIDQGLKPAASSDARLASGEPIILARRPYTIDGVPTSSVARWINVRSFRPGWDWAGFVFAANRLHPEFKSKARALTLTNVRIRNCRIMVGATHDGLKAQAETAQALVAANEYLTRMSVRAHIVSGIRMAWVDAVRDAVAELLSLDVAIRRAAANEVGVEFLDNVVQRREMIRHRLDLKLDPEKDRHSDLLRTVD